MKYLLGFTTETSSHGNDRSWGHSTNNVVDIIIKGDDILIRDYVNNAKLNDIELKELNEQIDAMSSKASSLSMFSNNETYVEQLCTEIYILEKKQTELSNLPQVSRYQTLLMINGEEL